MAKDYTSDFRLLNALRGIVNTLAYVSLAIVILSLGSWLTLKLYPQSGNYFNMEIEQSPDVAFRLPSITFREFLESLKSKDIHGKTDAPKDKLGSSLEAQDPDRSYVYLNDEAVGEEVAKVLAKELSVAPEPSSAGLPAARFTKRQSTETNLLIQKTVKAANELSRMLVQLPPDIDELTNFIDESASALPRVANRELKREFLNGMSRELIRWRERVSLGDDADVKSAPWYSFPTWYTAEFNRLLEDQLKQADLSKQGETLNDKIFKLVRSPNVLLALAAASFAIYLLLSILLLVLAVPLRIEQLLISISATVLEINKKAAAGSFTGETTDLSDWTVGDAHSEGEFKMDSSK